MLSKLECDHEIVLVNDGSTDDTLQIMSELQRSDPAVSIINLSRNFGKEIALTAGLDNTFGDVVVILDADLQDPPELIPSMIEAWREGFEVVYGVRTVRDGETLLKKASANAFYRLIQRVSRVQIPRDTGDFRLMSRRAILELRKLREQHRFMKGLFAWVGFRSKPIYYSREARVAGVTKWNYWKLFDLAIEGITSFSIAPLKLATYFGVGIAVLALIYAGVVVWKTLMYGDPVQGYPSLMVVLLFLGGVQLISVGVLGEYIGRIFNEVKARPLYLIDTATRSMLGTASIERSRGEADTAQVPQSSSASSHTSQLART